MMKCLWSCDFMCREGAGVDESEHVWECLVKEESVNEMEEKCYEKEGMKVEGDGGDGAGDDGTGYHTRARGN